MARKYKEEVENLIASAIIDSEVKTAQANQEADIGDYESTIDMLECKRTEKNYEWMSDVFIPEMPSIILTDAGGWANQYFQSRAFVECILDDPTEEGQGKCKAAKKLLNNSLNRRELYHYHKFIRARKINALAGRVFAVGWWERKHTLEQVGEEDVEEGMGQDQFGIEVEPGDPNEMKVTVRKPKMELRVVKDCFNYEIIDPANVFTDSKYVYSIQDKDWVIVRSEKSYQELLDAELDNGYINLDTIKELDGGGDGETEASKKTVGVDGNAKVAEKTPLKRWDIYERYGKYWYLEGEEVGEIEPGVDESGEPLDNAMLGEAVITIAVRGSSSVLIRFQKQKNTTPSGEPYRPLLRGICYIHPRKDEGLSDGKYLKEPQIAINDNFNIGMDRVKLATLPTLIGRKYALQDNETIYFEPEHVMEVEDPTTDLKELVISDNIKGTIDMNAMLTSKMQQVSSVYPTTMGDMPAASNTATAIAGAESRSNLRANYKSLTFENTFLIDFYTMILYMTDQFADESTMVKLMGEDATNFDPTPDYTYTPVSSNIEMEANKDRKLQRYDQMLARLAPFAQNPKIFVLANAILSRMFELQGDEFALYKKALLDERPPPQEEGGGQAGTSGPEMGGPVASNQSGNPMTQQEMSTRDAAQGMGGGMMGGTING